MHPENLPHKFAAAELNIFTTMSALAQEHQAVNLSQGFPDFAVDPALPQLLYEASKAGFNQYAPMAGLPGLRDAIAADIARRHGVTADAGTEITVTPGATYAIYTALSAVLRPGDEVVVLEPCYDSYKPNIEMQGAKPVGVKLQPETFRPDWQALKDAIGDKTRAIIVNTPHNPSGTVWSRADWDCLAALVSGRNIYILSDEVYDQLVFDGLQHTSVLQHPELRSRSFALFSFGKSLHSTGWKIGYCIAAQDLTKAFRNIHQFLSFSVNTPAQHALAHFLARPASGGAASALLQQKRDYFLELMQQTPFRLLAPAAGSYFQLASYAHLSDLPDTEYAVMLTRQYGVATIPVSVFYSDRHDDKILRFCFAKKEETLLQAAERLSRIG
ncbi:MAG: aminotransferase class I/II-fold pyridoxal phosphate-dependent enzyme [Chitinophagaceae bacterium]|nr:aminotransferase class I/II-fold pyridoxal phosphate-dependent enzyme [Chitinophagaceae bacterium]